MTLRGSATLFARALLVVALCCAGAARAGDESEAEKAAAEGDDAEKKSATLKDEVARGFDEFRPKLESLGQWCGDMEQWLERSRIADVLLAFDPESAKAREWLGFKRQKDGSWKPGPWRTPANARPEAQAEFAKRRTAIADPFRARFFPLLDRCSGWTEAGLRDRIVRSLVDLCPDDAAFREMHGEVKVKDKWLLQESADTPANRERFSALLLAARTDAAKVPRRLETATAKGWATALSADGLNVSSELCEDDTEVVTNAVLAVKILFSRTFQVEAKFPEHSRLYLLADGDANTRFLARVKDLDETRQRSLENFGSYWLRPTECVVARPDAGDRLDSATRQMLGHLKGPSVPLYDAPPWVAEGFGMYFVYKLLGTRKTVMVQPGSYSDTAIERDVAAVDADWVLVARKLVDKGYALNVPFLMGLPLNSITKDDGLLAYALSAYFIEGRPKDTAALLAALGGKGSKLHRALAEVCGIDAEALQYRFVRWLHEIPGK